MKRGIKFSWMNNPFKAGDKVLTKVKGQPVEAIVNQVWNDEVQVRTADKALLWRTVRTVTLVSAAVPATAEPKQEAQPPSNHVGGRSKPHKNQLKSGPAALSPKYKRTRSRWIKKGKI